MFSLNCISCVALSGPFGFPLVSRLKVKEDRLMLTCSSAGPDIYW
jgi:hypothetical protein